MKLYPKAILPRGFRASATVAGIKRSGRLDLAFIDFGAPAVAAHLFTTNTLQAAPLRLNQRYLGEHRTFRGLLVNSGNANCFTLRQGIRDAASLAERCARLLGVVPGTILVGSTGIIGRRLPVEKIDRALPGLCAAVTENGIQAAARAIMTTDTFAKEATARFCVGRTPVTVCGIAKGAGMIAPNMATMLCYVFTDASLTRARLERIVRRCAQTSFNAITIDGCMSTNDTLGVFANGQSRVRIASDAQERAFSQALGAVFLRLAQLIVRDAEGATKFVTIQVDGARSPREARGAALAVANSSLCKCAFYGSSPNIFGRTVAALGAAGVRFDEEKIKVTFSPLKKKDITLRIRLGSAGASATIYTCDLTPAYVRINAEYN